MLAMYHDYRVFNPSRGFLCLNEIDFGMPLSPSMSSIFREKAGSPAVYRSLVLEGKRFSAKEALEGGIVDVLGGLEEADVLVKERKLTEKGKSGVYGIMKAEMYRDTLAMLKLHLDGDGGAAELRAGDEKRKGEMKSRVEEWKRNTKSKL